MKKILTARNLKKLYGTKTNPIAALNGIDLDIEEGEFVSVMGPSGAGKTTLLNIIATIDYPTSGTIQIEETQLIRMSEEKLSNFRREHLGFIFQDFNLLDNLTVKENIILPLALANKTPRLINERLKTITEKLGIEDILEKYPVTISGGQKQKTAAARAVISDPTLILADEPTGALDSKSSADLLGCLKKLNQENNSTILMVTHDAFAASYSKRVIFIKDGKFFTEIYSSGERKDFFKKIMDILKSFGGDGSAVI